MNKQSFASDQENEGVCSEDEYSDDDRYAALAVVARTVRIRARRREPQSMHNSMLTGSMRVAELLNGHDEIIQGMVSMKSETFRSLSDLLRSRELLKPTHNMDVNEQLFIYLSICA